jgi:hypothetical protein
LRLFAGAIKGQATGPEPTQDLFGATRCRAAPITATSFSGVRAANVRNAPLTFENIFSTAGCG